MARKVGVKSEGSKWVILDLKTGRHIDVCNTEKEARKQQNLINSKK